MSLPPVDRRRARWLSLLHEWHWISSALCLLGMLLFAVTGITLNHAAQIEAHPTVVARDGQVPAELLRELQAYRLTLPAERSGTKAPLSPALVQWARSTWNVESRGLPAEWSAEEVYLSMPRPGGDAWLRIALDDGRAEYESTDRGWISYFNDLHKGRHTGSAWSWFIDIFAAAALIFSVTGLFILKMHAANRPLTWPVVGLGVIVPVLLALLFIH